MNRERVAVIIAAKTGRAFSYKFCLAIADRIIAEEGKDCTCKEPDRDYVGGELLPCQVCGKQIPEPQQPKLPEKLDVYAGLEDEDVQVKINEILDYLKARERK